MSYIPPQIHQPELVSVADNVDLSKPTSIYSDSSSSGSSSSSDSESGSADSSSDSESESDTTRESQRKRRYDMGFCPIFVKHRSLFQGSFKKAFSLKNYSTMHYYVFIQRIMSNQVYSKFRSPTFSYVCWMKFPRYL